MQFLRFAIHDKLHLLRPSLSCFQGLFRVCSAHASIQSLFRIRFRVPFLLCNECRIGGSGAACRADLRSRGVRRAFCKYVAAWRQAMV